MLTITMVNPKGTTAACLAQPRTFKATATEAVIQAQDTSAVDHIMSQSQRALSLPRTLKNFST